MTGQCHQICQHHDNVPSLTTSPAPPVIRHKAGRYWALELETNLREVFTEPREGLYYGFLLVESASHIRIFIKTQY